jgi:hypothetical protein
MCIAMSRLWGTVFFAHLEKNSLSPEFLIEVIFRLKEKNFAKKPL